MSGLCPPDCATCRALTDPTPVSRSDEGRLREALEDVVIWMEAEAEHPRPDPRPAMRLQAQYARDALAALPSEQSVHPDDDFVARARWYRDEHDATHGEAEQCGGPCIVLGLDDPSEQPVLAALDFTMPEPIANPVGYRVRIAVPEDHAPDGTVARWTAEGSAPVGYPYTYSTIGVSVQVDFIAALAAHDDGKAGGG